MRHGKPRIPPIELRKQQIYKELDKIREETRAKTRRHFRTHQGFGEWKRRRAEKVVELDAELSVLHDPGEYRRAAVRRRRRGARHHRGQGESSSQPEGAGAERHGR